MPNLDSDLAVARARLRTDTDRVGWPEAGEIRVRGNRRTTRRRFGVAAVAVLACAALVAAMAVARPGFRTERAPVAPLPTGLGPAVLRSLTSYVHGAGVSAVAVGHGSLWLGYYANFEKPSPTPGELVQLDLASLDVVATWPTVGSPASIAVTLEGVWIAGDIYDGKVDAMGADTVVEYAFDGTVRHSYSIISPFELTADPRDASVWVRHGEASTEGTFVTRLADGAASAPVHLSGSNVMRGGPATVICSDGLYAASQNAETATTHVQRISAGSLRGEALVDQSGFVSLACAQRGVSVAVTSDRSVLYWADFEGGRVITVLNGQFAHVLASTSELLWVSKPTGTDQTRVWAMVPQTVAIGVGVDVPAEITAAAAEGGKVWGIGFDTTRPGETIIAAITVS